MKLLFIGGFFENENSHEVIVNSKQSVDFAANIFQEKLIEGLRTVDEELRVVSAPFIGSYPKGYNEVWFKGFNSSQPQYQYVSFCNIWGIRNMSRYNAVIRKLQDFIKSEDDEKIIVVYSAHTPFLRAAVKAKQIDPRIKICLIVLDLPQYMNLSRRQSLLYKYAKRYDIWNFNRLNKYVDAYVLLTEQMTEVLEIQKTPYMVLEGIVRSSDLSASKETVTNKDVKKIFYAGTLNERYGVKTLIQAFHSIKDDSLQLVLCGRGDTEGFIKDIVRQDSRIIYLGQVTPDQVKELMASADLLVNPRPNNEVYTKYSFPSKNIEYLLSGKPVLGYILDGMPSCYRSFMMVVEDNYGETDEYNMKIALERAVAKDNYNNSSFIAYAQANLTAESAARKIVGMCIDKTANKSSC